MTRKHNTLSPHGAFSILKQKKMMNAATPSRLWASTVFQTVSGKRSSPRSEERGYRKYRLSGELCPTGSRALSGAMVGRSVLPPATPLCSLAGGYENHILQTDDHLDGLRVAQSVALECDPPITSHGSAFLLYITYRPLAICHKTSVVADGMKVHGLCHIIKQSLHYSIR